MGAFGGFILTKDGRALQTKAQAGAQLNFTRVAVGNGDLNGQSISDLHALISEKMSLTINKFKTMPDYQAVVGAKLSNQNVVTGFYFKEWGIFAQDPDVGEILYCYANSGSGAEYIAAGGGSDVIEKQIDCIVIIANVSNVSATINTSLTYITLDQIGVSGGVASLDANGQVPDTQIPAITDVKIGNRTISDAMAPTGDTGLITTLFGWLANMIKAITGKSSWRTAPATTLEAANTHMNRTDNPHAVTAAQIGAANILAQMLTVDGAGSGLDADLFDGLNSLAFMQDYAYINYWASNDANTAVKSGAYKFQSGSLNTPTNDWCTILTVAADTNRIIQIAQPWNAGNFLYWRRNNAGVWTAWAKIWTADSDGAGSGLDSDLLDGLNSGNASGNIPISNGTKNVNLQADLVDGMHFRENAGVPQYSVDGGVTWKDMGKFWDKYKTPILYNALPALSTTGSWVTLFSVTGEGFLSHAYLRPDSSGYVNGVKVIVDGVEIYSLDSTGANLSVSYNYGIATIEHLIANNTFAPVGVSISGAVFQSVGSAVPFVDTSSSNAKSGILLDKPYPFSSSVQLQVKLAVGAPSLTLQGANVGGVMI
ncbi:phage tail-collar fiber domain-containing protein [Ferviditalea candida]|uniref:Phage tail protein n=1 Tax=Ferviditalea candida TaxID=3108399 RepID=A0ABU5ZKU7_9BACL|nr:phage tail protein [Paenibacillaceae bacterium T2]